MQVSYVHDESQLFWSDNTIILPIGAPYWEENGADSWILVFAHVVYFVYLICFPQIK